MVLCQICRYLEGDARKSVAGVQPQLASTFVHQPQRVRSEASHRTIAMSARLTKECSTRDWPISLPIVLQCSPSIISSQATLNELFSSCSCLPSTMDNSSQKPDSSSPSSSQPSPQPSPQPSSSFTTSQASSSSISSSQTLCGSSYVPGPEELKTVAALKKVTFRTGYICAKQAD